MTDTINPIPEPGSAFNDDLQEFLANEDANRYADIFSDIVVSGGIFEIGTGLTHTPSELLAYPSGFYVTENGSITFSDDKTTWVAVFKDTETTSFIGTWQRVSGTHYIIDEDSGTDQPGLPDGAMYLMEVTTAGGSVTVVDDLRPDFPFSQNNSKELFFAGDAVVSTNIINKFKFRSNVTIDRIFLDAQTAPTGTSLQVDILKNGVLQSQIATLDAGENFQQTKITPIVFTSDDEFGLQFTQIGSILPGSNIQAIVGFTGGTSVSSIEDIEAQAAQITQALARAANAVAQSTSSADAAQTAEENAKASETLAFFFATSQKVASTAAAEQAAQEAEAALAEILDQKPLYAEVLQISANHAVVAADNGKLISVDTSSGDIDITLPNSTALTTDFRVGIVKNTPDANVINISVQGSDTVNRVTSDIVQEVVENTVLYVLDQSIAAWIASNVGGTRSPGELSDFAGAVAPFGSVFCDGSTYNSVTDLSLAALFARIGTNYGGTGAADFDVPDMRGRTHIGLDNLGGSSANRMTNGNADSLGGSAGAESVALSTANLASHTHAGPAHTHTYNTRAAATSLAGSGVPVNTGLSSPQTASSGTAATGAAGSGSAFDKTQPWQACTKIIWK